jgi:hypothetical protein
VVRLELLVKEWFFLFWYADSNNMATTGQTFDIPETMAGDKGSVLALLAAINANLTDLNSTLKS